MSAAVIMAYVSGQERKQRAFLMQLFSRHVSKEVAENIWRQRDQFLEDGRPKPQKAEVTVLFTDLTGFTSVSEKLEPQALIQWLNTYMEAMAQLVMGNEGIVDDYAGDGIKANFGVPIPRKSQAEIKQDALNAVNCALQMKTKMQRLNRNWRNQNLPTAGIRIGICTGPVIVGAVGSSQRLKYTTVGDTVNVASRLESFEKEQVPEGICRMLIAESTHRYVQEHFQMQTVGAIQLKGKKQTAFAYLVIDEN
jgi:adenylate cyclase